MRRILHFIDSGGVYGAENVILNLSQLMKSSDRYIPIIGCIVSNKFEASELYDRAINLGISAEKIVIRNNFLIMDLFRVAKQFNKLNIHIVHSHGYKPSVFAYAIQWLTNIDIIATCHLWYFENNRPLKMRIMVRLELLAYRTFKIIVGVSEPIRNILVESGISSDKVHVVRNGVEMERDTIVSPTMLLHQKNELNYNNDYCIINIGRLTMQKAQCDIVSAARIVIDRGVKCHFIIVGEGELKETLQKQIDKLYLTKHVTLLGFRTDLGSLLAISSLFILPSLDEGMPMSLLEAAAACVPIIATPVGDIPKLIIDNESGLLVPPKDVESLAASISTLYDDPIKAEKLASVARHKVEAEYSDKAMFGHYDVLYQMF
jgi:glycosyltransferase involved in cell wall biosynthesis